MAQCDVCGNDYHLAFQVIAGGSHAYLRQLRVRDPQARARSARIAAAGSSGTASRRRGSSTAVRTAPGTTGCAASPITSEVAADVLRLRYLFGIVSGTAQARYICCACRFTPYRRSPLCQSSPFPPATTRSRRTSSSPGCRPPSPSWKRCSMRRPTVPPMLRPDGTIMHTELQIGDSRIMMAEATEQWKPMPCVHLPLPARLRRQLQARHRRRRHVAHGTGRPVLRRSDGRCARPGGEPVVDRHARRGCAAGGDGSPPVRVSRDPDRPGVSAEARPLPRSRRHADRRYRFRPQPGRSRPPSGRGGVGGAGQCGRMARVVVTNQSGHRTRHHFRGRLPGWWRANSNGSSPTQRRPARPAAPLPALPRHQRALRVPQARASSSTAMPSRGSASTRCRAGSSATGCAISRRQGRWVVGRCMC